jgi:myo-inositol-1(or 4)-monophosphatase
VTSEQALRASDLLVEAHALADLAGARILPHFRKPMQIENKQAGGGFDPVTAADKAAERVMRQALRKRFPGHAIVGEEYAAHISASRYRWVLDPIDGTRAFICGFPLWGVLIGLLDGDDPILGMMDQPYTRERFWAAGGKARMRDASGKTRTLKTRSCSKLSDATLVATAPDMFKSDAEQSAFARVSSGARLTRFGGDCYAYCMLAAGQVDLVVEASLKQVDIVALIPIIESAGGVVTSWDGGTAINGGRIVAAGDPRLHATALKLLSTSKG